MEAFFTNIAFDSNSNTYFSVMNSFIFLTDFPLLFLTQLIRVHISIDLLFYKTLLNALYIKMFYIDYSYVLTLMDDVQTRTKDLSKAILILLINTFLFFLNLV